LNFQPKNFLVDDDTERAKAVDEDFQHKVANWIQTGTKKNMLGSKLLNADIFPDISVEIKLQNVKIESITAEPRELLFLVSVNLKGNTYDMQLPAQLSVTEQNLTVSGDFRLNH